jgi:acyl carrier protein
LSRVIASEAKQSFNIGDTNMNTQTDIESKLKGIFKKVLDIKESEIVPGAKLDESLGIDSTEMVEISVVIKKEFGVSLNGDELKKTHSFNDIVGILKTK